MVPCAPAAAVRHYRPGTYGAVCIAAVASAVAQDAGIDRQDVARLQGSDQRSTCEPHGAHVKRLKEIAHIRCSAGTGLKTDLLMTNELHGCTSCITSIGLRQEALRGASPQLAASLTVRKVTRPALSSVENVLPLSFTWKYRPTWKCAQQP
jgi:hypothetical protein